MKQNQFFPQKSSRSNYNSFLTLSSILIILNLPSLSNQKGILSTQNITFCRQNCKKCSSDNICSQCNESYYLSSQNSCLQCSPNCLTCISDPSLCTSCFGNAKLLEDGRCPTESLITFFILLFLLITVLFLSLSFLIYFLVQNS